jgi:2-oxo-3-hexenedioate decarboxylase
MIDVAALAREMVAALDGSGVVIPPTERYPNLDFETAYAVARESSRLRRVRGEQPAGRKIGYTNRDMWARFNVHQPIWDHMYAHTVHEVDHGSASLSLAGMVAPRIEPEIAFKLRAPPHVACDDPATVLQSVEWVARTFEIVDCHYADWKFSGPDSVIDFGHHAALMVGAPRAISPGDTPQLVRELRDCRVTLVRNGRLVDSGVGANALGHPALALACLADVVASQPEAPPLAAGEIITTGTLTMAPFAAAGETWRTETDGLDLPPLTATFV